MARPDRWKDRVFTTKDTKHRKECIKPLFILPESIPEIVDYSDDPTGCPEGRYRPSPFVHPSRFFVALVVKNAVCRPVRPIQ